MEKLLLTCTLIMLFLNGSCCTAQDFLTPLATISWNQVSEENRTPYIPGKIITKSFSCDVVWRFETYEFGELYAVTKTDNCSSLTLEKLYLMPFNDGTTLILKQKPLIMSLSRAQLEQLAFVNTNDLLAVFSKEISYIPSRLNPKLKSIVWNTAYENNGAFYTPGIITVDYGTFNFFWKYIPNTVPELVIIKAMGIGELPATEQKLHFFVNENTQTAAVLEEHSPLYQQPGFPYMRQIAVVDYHDLMNGLTMIKQ